MKIVEPAVNFTQPGLIRDNEAGLPPLRRNYGHALYGHLTRGGMDERIESTLPPVFRPKAVPRS